MTQQLSASSNFDTGTIRKGHRGEMAEKSNSANKCCKIERDDKGKLMRALCTRKFSWWWPRMKITLMGWERLRRSIVDAQHFPSPLWLLNAGYQRR